MTMQMPITCTENAGHAIARYTKWELFEHYIIFIFLLNLSLILFYSIINAKTPSDLLPPFFFIVAVDFFLLCLTDRLIQSICSMMKYYKLYLKFI
jgi:hypothetical protein